MKEILWTVAASMLLFACSNDKENVSDDPQGQVFELSAVNEATNGVITRTRPLYSQDAIQEVENVNIYVFSQNGADYTYTSTYHVPGWSKGSTFMRFVVPDNSKLSAGNYNFLLVGREATDNYTLTPLTPGVTKIGDVLASVSVVGTESEMFAGTQAVAVSSEGLRASMTMTRRVAGLLGYFSNVPAILGSSNVKYLRLIMSDAGMNVNLSSGTSSMSFGAADTILNVDLSGQTVTSTGVFAGNNLSAQGVVKVVNSQLYGKFLLPVGPVTMTLGLYDANGVALKTWAVQDAGSPNINMMANQFYSLGRKINKGDTTGGGTPDPGDDDAPIDLLKDQVVVITIDPAWGTLHNLVIQ